MGTAVAWKASVHGNGFAYGGIEGGMNAYMRRRGFDKAIMHGWVLGLASNVCCMNSLRRILAVRSTVDTHHQRVLREYQRCG